MTQSQIADANALAKPGKPPFHLKVDFQVFDFYGKPSDKGTIEYWWAGPDGFHSNITAPSLTATPSSKNAQFSAQRTRYLTDQLLNDILAPAPELSSPGMHTESEERVFGTTVLECLHQTFPAGTPASRVPRYQVCSDPKSGNIRMIEGTGFTIVRNQPGRFGLTRTDLDTTISYGQMQAITGHITQLEAFDPAKSTVALDKPPADAPTSKGSLRDVRLAGGVVAGHKTGGAVPVYPAEARQRHITGTVIMAAVISKEGKIESLVPLSSSDGLLTDAALEAVQSWTYVPYLLNGSPTEVSTTITVNFNMN